MSENGWDFDPEEEWGVPLGGSDQVKDIVEGNVDPSYSGYGNENFQVFGNWFKARPEIAFLLEEDLEDPNNSTFYDGKRADLVLSKGLWDSLDEKMKESLGVENPWEYRKISAHTPDYDSRFDGYLRVEAGQGYDVTIRTEEGENVSKNLYGSPTV